MKIGVFSDLHLDAVTGGMPRFDDVRDGLIEVVEKCGQRRVDAAVFCGDLCNPDAGSVVIQAVHCAQLAALSLVQLGIPSFWLAGNHDVIEDGRGHSTITPISVVDRDRVKVIEGAPQVFTVKGVDLLFLPYPPRVLRYDPAAEVDRLYPSKPTRPIVSFAHLQIDGAQLGSETRDFARGADVQHPTDALKRLGVSVMVSGHYHKRQVINGVMCVGTLERLRFDEADNRAGWMVVEI